MAYWSSLEKKLNKNVIKTCHCIPYKIEIITKFIFTYGNNRMFKIGLHV